MKYFLALAILLIGGCTHPSGPNTGPMSSAFQPGGIYYVSPGTFNGTWIKYTFTPILDTDSCTAVITEADSLLFGTITNDSTKEILTVTGFHLSSSSELHDYEVTTAGTLGDTAEGVLKFSLTTDTLRYGPYSSVNPPPIIPINCVRKK